MYGNEQKIKMKKKKKKVVNFSKQQTKMIKLNVFSCICAFVTNRRVTGGHQDPEVVQLKKNIISVFKKLSKEQRRAFFNTERKKKASVLGYIHAEPHWPREATKIWKWKSVKKKKNKLKHPRAEHMYFPSHFEKLIVNFETVHFMIWIDKRQQPVELPLLQCTAVALPTHNRLIFQIKH
jgi:hypothetical protein